MSEVSWSYSKLTLYEQCPAKFKYRYILGLPGAGSAAMERGTAYHKALELHGPGTPTPLWLAPHLPHIQGVMKGAKREHIITFAPKWEKLKEGARYWFKAVLDIMQIKKKVGVVVDWKTGKEYDTHVDQLELYSAAAVVHHDLDIVTGYGYYLDMPPGAMREKVKVTKAGAKGILHFWDERLKPMTTDKIHAARPGHYCNWCDYSRNKGGPCTKG